MKTLLIDDQREVLINYPVGSTVSALTGNSHVATQIVRLLTAICSGEAIELFPKENERESSAPGLPLTESSIGWLWQANNEEFVARCEASKCKIGLQTSGTTGKPKLVWHRMTTLIRGVRRGERYANATWGLCYDPARMAGLQVVLQAICNRNTIVNLAGLPPDRAIQTIVEHRVSHVSATPTHFRLLSMTGKQAAVVQHVASGGEAVQTGLSQAINRTFPKATYRNIYASTELGSLLTSKGENFAVPAELAGKIRVSEGQLEVHRSLLGASAASVCEGEYFATGDQVRVVSDRPLAFHFTARRGDEINVAGNKVCPQKVERELLRLPEVLDVVVYGKKNSVTGSIVCCDIVTHLQAPLGVNEIRRGVGDTLADYELPRIVRHVDRLDTNESGKKVRAK